MGRRGRGRGERIESFFTRHFFAVRLLTRERISIRQRIYDIKDIYKVTHGGDRRKTTAEKREKMTEDNVPGDIRCVTRGTRSNKIQRNLRSAHSNQIFKLCLLNQLTLPCGNFPFFFLSSFSRIRRAFSLLSCPSRSFVRSLVRQVNGQVLLLSDCRRVNNSVRKLGSFPSPARRRRRRRRRRAARRYAVV